VAQRVGLSVAEIRQLMSELPERREITVDDWFRLRHRLEEEVRQRIQALTEVLDDLTSDQKLCELPPVQPATSQRAPITTASHTEQDPYTPDGDRWLERRPSATRER
jgi:DNA-binding transcriptional MerR regulator